jgi:hypothetical protein
MTIFISIFIVGLFGIIWDAIHQEVYGDDCFSIPTMLLLLIGGGGIIALHFYSLFIVQSC